ncbi:hypothetical protein CEP51_015808 [Fusarium floridanum]|uniref:Uncharacterized protein n=1 Tax=Fusarium floridanum TaxID=1325733 RepID=A0A428P2G8_9HYPO|nr:hypothetical protein CEP51_015808 [Fusarium floridanum]
MSQPRLMQVREDDNVKVLTEHPDYIDPEALSRSLAIEWGEGRFRISLRRNIYVIYIYQQPEANAWIQIPEVTGQGLPQKKPMMLVDRRQRLEDVKLAEEKLKKARLSRM